MIRAVLDTNVVVSAHLNSEGQAAIILGLAFGRHFRWFVSRALLEEYEGVLRREKFDLNPREVASSIRAIRRMATLVEPRRKVSVTHDPDDNKVLECALEARADYVVTGNTRDFPSRYRDIRVLRPVQFLTVLAAEPF